MKKRTKEVLINIFAIMVYLPLVLVAIVRAGPIVNTPVFLFAMFIMGISVGTWVLGIIMAILWRNY